MYILISLTDANLLDMLSLSQGKILASHLQRAGLEAFRNCSIDTITSYLHAWAMEIWK